MALSNFYAIYKYVCSHCVCICVCLCVCAIADTDVFRYICNIPQKLYECVSCWVCMCVHLCVCAIADTDVFRYICKYLRNLDENVKWFPILFEEHSTKLTKITPKCPKQREAQLIC